jgi:hypothetical protein
VRLREIYNGDKSPNTKQHAAKRAVETLLFYDVVVIVMCLFILICSTIDYRGANGQAKCNSIMKTVGAFYVTSNILLNWLMFQRASVVLQSKLFIGHRSIHILLKQMSNVILTLPLTIPITYVSSFGARLPTSCVFIVPKPPSIIFITSYVIITLALLFLLVYPLYLIVPKSVAPTGNDSTFADTEIQQPIDGRTVTARDRGVAMRVNLIKVCTYF